MPKQRKAIMSESYLDALKQKSNDKFVRQAGQIVKEAKHEENLRKARHEALLTKHQKKIVAKKAEISEYSRLLEKAETAESENIYGLLGMGALLLFVVAAFVTIIMWRSGAESSSTLIACVLSITLLCVSLGAQSLSLETEKKVREYKFKLKIAQRELEDLKLPLSK